MATNLSSFRDRIIPFVPGCPIPAIDQAVMDAVQKFCAETKILKKSFEALEVDYTTIDAADSDSIDINLASYAGGYWPIAVIGGQVDGTDYFFKNLELENDNSNIDDIVEDDTFFYNFHTNTFVKIFPFTNWGADFDIYLTLAVRPNPSNTSVDDLFYDDWLRAINALATSELQRIPGKKWTDLKQAQINLSIYDEERSRANAKIRAERSTRRRPVKTGYI